METLYDTIFPGPYDHHPEEKRVWILLLQLLTGDEQISSGSKLVLALRCNYQEVLKGSADTLVNYLSYVQRLITNMEMQTKVTMLLPAIVKSDAAAVAEYATTSAVGAAEEPATNKQKSWKMALSYVRSLFKLPGLKS